MLSSGMECNLALCWPQNADCGQWGDAKGSQILLLTRKKGSEFPILEEFKQRSDVIVTEIEGRGRGVEEVLQTQD